MRVCCICGKPYEGYGNDPRPVEKWGDCRNYDVSLNSSKLGIDGSVKLLTEYIDRRRQ